MSDHEFFEDLISSEKVETIQNFLIFSQISGSLGTSRILWKLRMVKTKVNDTKNIETGRFHRFCLNKSQNSCQNVDFCLIQVLQN